MRSAFPPIGALARPPLSDPSSILPVPALEQLNP